MRFVSAIRCICCRRNLARCSRNLALSASLILLLSRASLSRASLSRASLSRASLSRASLSRASLSREGVSLVLKRSRRALIRFRFDIAVSP
ncbi:pentapeptide repeat-containing protein [Longimonas sp.]|uniref:pentapeptide repeat-containing protein n=1 Tax=Longimonas sp. TaxID=2039626 RepID=UPI003975E368